jgi:hypothetical protein
MNIKDAYLPGIIFILQVPDYNNGTEAGTVSIGSIEIMVSIESLRQQRDSLTRDLCYRRMPLRRFARQSIRWRILPQEN